jgi:hypothetical protein
MAKQSTRDLLREMLIKVSDKHDADIFLFSAGVDYLTADRFILKLRQIPERRTNCILVLTTYGGDPDAGYRIVRAIKRYYEKFILFSFGSCKSTGTLMALGADYIVMSDFGEFGPLDIQLAKDDELTNMSGLNYIQSLISINENTFRFFEQNFLDLKQASAGTISTRTAAEIATKLAIGITSPISGQIDPIKLGEVQRAMNIAVAYGERLAITRMDLCMKLITGYPSHGFVIDIEEAMELFKNIEEAENEELMLEQLLFRETRRESEVPLIKILLSKETFDGQARSIVGQEEKIDEVAGDSPIQQDPSQNVAQHNVTHEISDSTNNQPSENGQETVEQRSV